MEGGSVYNAFQVEALRMLNSNANDSNKLIVSLLMGMIQYNHTMMESVQALTHEIRSLKESSQKENPSTRTIIEKVDALAAANAVMQSTPAQPIIINSPPPPPAPRAPKSYSAAARTKTPPQPPASNTKTKAKEVSRRLGISSGGSVAVALS